MPIEKHPNLRLPSPDKKLWRHLDLPKFLSLLEDQALWFACLDQLNDPYEGLPPKANVEEMLRLEQAEERERKPEIARRTTRVLSDSPKHLFVSCWYAAPVESAAMWRIYSTSDAGLAIRTTLGQLDESLGEPSVVVPGGIYGGLVRYVDFETFLSSSLNAFEWAALKRESFEHEREFRLIAIPGQNLPGFKVSVDVPILVSDVWIAPTAPTWYKELVRKVCRRYALDAEVYQSQLLRHPAYLADKGGPDSP